MKERNNQIVSETFAGTINVALSLLDPIGAMAGAFLSPVMKNLAEDFLNRTLSESEKQRVSNTFLLIVDKIKQNIDDGLLPREDFFNGKECNHSHAKAILEGVLLKAKDEYEEKKLKYYSNFCANLCFDPSTSFERANMLLKLVERLSYRQLIIIGYISNIKELNTEKWDIVFKEKQNLAQYYDLYSEVIDLYNCRLIQQANRGLSMSLIACELSAIGKTLISLMELTTLPDSDIQIVKDTIYMINHNI